MPAKTILIMAGGTGGHVYPALAVARELLHRGETVEWLGTRQGLEARIVPGQCIPLHTIHILGLRGKGLLRLCLAPVLVLRAMIESMQILRRVRPAVVLGMGGFVSGPGGIAAWLLRLPLCIHEQNAIAGLTNRLLRPLARVVLQAFPGTFTPGENVYTPGNPVRAEFLDIPQPAQRFRQRDHETVSLLVVGGSLGALTLNRVVPAALAALSATMHFQVRHQTGPRHIEMTRSCYRDNGMEADIVDYIEDMAAAYSWADLVVCRAGAMTIAELAAVGVGSILVPYPHAVDDHQTANARYLTDTGCAVLIPEHELNAAKLAAVLADLCASRQRLLGMAEECRSLARPDATREVVDHCLEVACAWSAK